MGLTDRAHSHLFFFLICCFFDRSLLLTLVRLLYLVIQMVLTHGCCWQIAGINLEGCSVQCTSFYCYCLYVLTQFNNQAVGSKNLLSNFDTYFWNLMISRNHPRRNQGLATLLIGVVCSRWVSRVLNTQLASNHAKLRVRPHILWDTWAQLWSSSFSCALQRVCGW